MFYNVFAPFSSLRFGAEAVGLSDADVMEYIRTDKNAVMQALDVIAQTNALLAELLITEAGCDGVYYCVQGGEYDRFTPEEYRKIITPSDLYVLEHANRYSENNIIHMCGWAGNRNQLAIWQDYPAKVVNWAVFVEGLTLDAGRYFIGGRTSLGGFETHWDEHTQQGIIYTGTKEEAVSYTHLDVYKRQFFHRKKGWRKIMKAIMVMYDSLNRHMLSPYGCDWTQTPNFKRLADRCVTFDKCYVGSLPCMPARREIHTGRYNFLHRSWGPMEPYDDSMPEILKKNGIYSHLISDHYHYWEDGAVSYTHLDVYKRQYQYHRETDRKQPGFSF